MILPPSVCHSLKFVRSFGKVNDTEDKNIDLNNTVTIWIFRRKIRNIRDQFFLTHENYENNKFNFWYLSLLQFSARLYSSVCRVAIMNISKTVQPPFDSQKFMYGEKNPGTARGEMRWNEARYVGWPRRRVTPFYLPMSPKKQSKIRPTSVGVEMSLSPSCLYFFRPWT